MAQYMVREQTTRQFASVDDNQVEAYKAEGWTEATPADVEHWRRTDVYGGLQGAPVAPALGSPGTVPATQQAPAGPPPANPQDRAEAIARAQAEKEAEAQTLLVPHTPPSEVAAPGHPPLTTGEPAVGSSLAQAQAEGQLPSSRCRPAGRARSSPGRVARWTRPMRMSLPGQDRGPRSSPGQVRRLKQGSRRTLRPRGPPRRASEEGQGAWCGQPWRG
jgi:hypothetical protein